MFLCWLFVGLPDRDEFVDSAVKLLKVDFLPTVQKNSASKASASPYTISAGDALIPSFGDVLNPRNTQGSCNFQPSEVCLAMRAALSVHCVRFIIPLAAQVYDFVRWRVVQRIWVREDKSCEVKVMPRSKVMCLACWICWSTLRGELLRRMLPLPLELFQSISLTCHWWWRGVVPLLKERGPRPFNIDMIESVGGLVELANSRFSVPCNFATRGCMPSPSVWCRPSCHAEWRPALSVWQFNIQTHLRRAIGMKGMGNWY